MSQRHHQGRTWSRSGSASTASMEHMRDQLNNLKDLKNLGIIDHAEYNVRRNQLIDVLTGTNLSKHISRSVTLAKPYLPSPSIYTHVVSPNYINQPEDHKQIILQALAPYISPTDKSLKIISKDRPSRPQTTKYPQMPDPWLNTRPPPDFSSIPCERAYKYVMDQVTGDWSRSEVLVKIDATPFARGSLRHAYHCLELCENRCGVDLDSLGNCNAGLNCVGKVAVDPDEERETYFLDVWIQLKAHEWAKWYNKCEPPKKVEFITAWVLQLIDRPESPLCGVEPYIGGEYRKHNNNFGYVSEEERNTPQAFSHFSYQVSNQRLLICDIQGVNDLYTDPQIHSKVGSEYGKGDMGQEGIDRFITSHRCNAICKYLKLNPLNSKTIAEGGTRYENGDVVEIDDRFIVFEESLSGPKKPSEANLRRSEYYPAGPSDSPASNHTVGPQKRSLFQCCTIL